MNRRTLIVCVLLGALAMAPFSLAGKEEREIPDKVAFGKEDAYKARVRKLLYQEEFDLLEETATRMRREKTRIPGGDLKLQLFYRGLGAPAKDQEASRKDWNRHMEKATKWAAARSDSITAQVALAASCVSLAWKERGSGPAETVSDEERGLFGENLRKAMEILLRCRDFPEKDPVWYKVMNQVSLGLGRTPVEYDRYFSEGVGLDPRLFILYAQKSQYLLPQWYGEDGDWEAFALNASKRLGGKEGSALLAYIAAYVLKYAYDFAAPNALVRLGWKEIQQGFADLKELHGLDKFALNAYCRYAWYAGDMKTAAALFDAIGSKWSKQVWRSQTLYENAKSTARARSGRRNDSLRPPYPVDASRSGRFP